MATAPLVHLRQFDTYRLIPSRFVDKEDSVLVPLSEDAAHLADIFELDNATNARLIAEHGRASGIGVDELVFGVPNFRMINAAYTYARPEGSRFNTDERGAWYCGFELQTALDEIIFHKTVEYAEIDRFDDSVRYQVLLADFNSEFHDLRGSSRHAKCLAPDSYVASQKLAVQLLDEGSLGIIYPSVRHAGGTNLACFRPALVGNVRRGQVLELSWSGTPQPKVKTVRK
ncbi:RES domain protein [compost metagenome]